MDIIWPSLMNVGPRRSRLSTASRASAACRRRVPPIRRSVEAAPRRIRRRGAHALQSYPAARRGPAPARRGRPAGPAGSRWPAWSARAPRCRQTWSSATQARRDGPASMQQWSPHCTPAVGGGRGVGGGGRGGTRLGPWRGPPKALPSRWCRQGRRRRPVPRALPPVSTAPAPAHACTETLQLGQQAAAAGRLGLIDSDREAKHWGGHRGGARTAPTSGSTHQRQHPPAVARPRPPRWGQSRQHPCAAC